MRHTVQIRPEFHLYDLHVRFGLGDGLPQKVIHGYNVEFYKAGVYVENRSYSFSDEDERTMMRRISSWVRNGRLS